MADKRPGAQPRSPGRTGRPWQRARQKCLAISDVCYMCGHAGSQDVDHIEPLAHGGASLDPKNLAPLHGAYGCPTCGRKCNQEKGDKPLSAVVRLRTSVDWYSPAPQNF